MTPRSHPRPAGRSTALPAARGAWAALVAAAAVLATGCGEPDVDASPGQTASQVAGETDAAPLDAPETEVAVHTPSLTPPPEAADPDVATAPAAPVATDPALAADSPESIVDPAEVGQPPVRLPAHAGPLRIAWIGGSEVELHDVSLPAAAAAAFPELAGREVDFVGISDVAPTAARTAEWVEQAVADGADALVVSFNVSWLYLHECAGITPPHTFYACVLGPIDDATVAANAVSVRALIDTIVATRLPTVAVVMPHSTTALADPSLADLIATAEARMASLDPHAPNLHLLMGITAGRPGFEEGDGFHDMVHLTPAGAERLADAIVTAAAAWWETVGLVP